MARLVPAELLEVPHQLVAEVDPKVVAEEAPAAVDDRLGMTWAVFTGCLKRSTTHLNAVAACW